MGSPLSVSPRHHYLMRFIGPVSLPSDTREAKTGRTSLARSARVSRTRRRREEPPQTQKRPPEQMPRQERDDVAQHQADAKRCERFVRAFPGLQRRKRDLVQEVQA